MNVVLFDSSEADQNSLCLSDQRARHIVSVLKLKADDEVRIGAINGRLGVGRVQTVAHDAKSGRFDVRLEIKRLDEESPPKSSIELILALPRPKSLRRCLRMIANLGIKSVHLIHSSRVEKSYWSTPFLDHQSMRASLLEGLAIARDTVLPEVKIYKLFKPFVQDVAPSLIHTYGYVAHPSSHLQQAISKPIAPIPGALHDPKIPVAIGPEGGFTEYEIGLFQESGYQPLSLGSRIYSVECAVPSLHQIILSNRPVPGEMNP